MTVRAVGPMGRPPRRMGKALLDCPDHHVLSFGSCRTCGREVCELCLRGAPAPDAFECPDCGERGMIVYDADYSDLVNERSPERREPDL